MREPTFLILAAVAPEPLHGYGIIRAVEELSDGRVRLRPGTLYAALDRLVGEGVLTIDREEVVDGRLRRYYRITDPGLDVLRRGVERYEANAAAARHQLARRPGAPLDDPDPTAPSEAPEPADRTEPEGPAEPAGPVEPVRQTSEPERRRA